MVESSNAGRERHHVASGREGSRTGSMLCSTPVSASVFASERLIENRRMGAGVRKNGRVRRGGTTPVLAPFRPSNRV